MCPPSLDEVMQAFKSVPKTHLYKISTIPNGKDVTMNQFIAYVSKFAVAYFLVRGAANGTHFHGLVVFDGKKRAVRPSWTKQKISKNRGFAPLFPKKERYYDPVIDGPEAVAEREYIRDHLESKSASITLRNIQRSKYPILELHIQSKYEEYLRREKSGIAKRKRAKYAKEYSDGVAGWYHYLMKNIEENPAPYLMYNHYALRSYKKPPRPRPGGDECSIIV